MWHDDEWMKKNIPDKAEFDYHAIDSLQKFSGTHPSVMADKIKKQNWDFKYDVSESKVSLADRLLFFIEKKTGWRAGEYKNYKLI